MINDLDCLVFVINFEPKYYVLEPQASERSMPTVTNLCDSEISYGCGRKRPVCPAIPPDSVSRQGASFCGRVGEVLATDNKRHLLVPEIDLPMSL